MQPGTKGLFLIWITVILWGISFVATKVVVNYIPPITAGFIRFILAASVMLIFIRKDIKYEKKEWFNLFMASFFGVTGYFLFENTGLMYTTATNGSLIISAIPIIFLIIDDIIKKTFSNKIRYIGTLIAFIGVAVLILNGKFVLKLNPKGDLLMFGAVISWILYTIFLEKLQKHNNLIVTRDINMFGAIFFIPFVFIELKSSPTCPVFSLWFQPSVVFALLYLGIFCSALGYIFWNEAIRLSGSKTVMNSVYFIPVVTVISESLIYKTFPNIYTIIGAILVIGGTFISEKFAVKDSRVSKIND